jgi:chorismate mutase
VSDDAIQDLLDEMDAIAAGDKVSHWTITRARGQHEAWRARVAELTSALEGRAVEVAELQKQLAGSLEERAALAHEVAELKADEDFADGVIVSLTVDVADLRKKVTELTAARDKEFARAEEWRATVADLSRQYALGEDEATIAKLLAKVARLESAIADQVIADGVARGG